MTATKTNPTEAALAFATECRESGWTWSVRGSVVTIETRFAAGDKAAYSKADGEAFGLLGAGSPQGRVGLGYGRRLGRRIRRAPVPDLFRR